jgi:D-alanine-D-alanine ligase
MAIGNKLQVGVLFGGRSGEHAVSLRSARAVLEALDREKYDLTQIGITRQGAWLVGSQGEDVLGMFGSATTAPLSRAFISPDPTHSGLYRLTDTDGEQAISRLAELDVVFPVLHGTFGEDGTIQGLLELADLAYVGAGVLGSALAMDKAVFKDVMQAHGLPVLESLVLLRGEIENDTEAVVRRAEDLAPYPLFTKPANLGSSVGITKCRSRADLMEGMLEAAQFDRRVLIERGVIGREIEVSVLGNEAPQASVPGEIVPYGDFYTYESKYHEARSRLIIPAPISEEQSRRVRELAVEAYRLIDCAGMARVDFLMDRETHAIYLNEINTIPGFTDISMYAKLWEATGLPYPDLCDRLIELALSRKADRDKTVREYVRPENQSA